MKTRRLKFYATLRKLISGLISNVLHNLIYKAFFVDIIQ